MKQHYRPLMYRGAVWNDISQNATRMSTVELELWQNIQLTKYTPRQDMWVQSLL